MRGVYNGETYDLYGDETVLPNDVTDVLSHFGASYSTKLTTTPPTVFDSLTNLPSLTTIYVPSQSVEAYKAASGWSDYASMIQAIPN